MSDVRVHIENARNEVADLKHKLEIAEVRLETLEMIVDPLATADTSQGNGHGGGRAPNGGSTARSSGGVMIHTKAAPIIRTTNTRRAPAGSWRAVFAKLLEMGKKQFSYDDVVEAAKDIGVVTTKPSARVRVSKFKDQGHLERVSDGVYKPTKDGMTFFKG